jgi:peptidoglycan/LPS O-acetylase OafA/YrhL
MLRIIAEGLAFFLLPFMLFALYLAIVGQNPLRPDVWSRKALSSLTLAALGLCIVAMVAIGFTVERRGGAYVPSHVDKDGRFVPGQFRD